MGIRAKTIGVLTIVVLLLLGAMMASIYVLGRQFALGVEDRDASEALNRAEAVISQNEKEVGSLSNDWAAWTDTLNFVNGKAPTYVAENLDGSYIRSLGLEYMVFCAAGGRPIYSFQVDAKGTTATIDPGILRVIRDDPALTHLNNPTKATVALAKASKGVVVLSAHAITNNNATSPPSGTFIAGRFLDASAFALAKRFIAASVRVYAAPPGGIAPTGAESRELADGTVIRPTSAGTMSVYRLQTDVFGKKSVVLQVDVPRVAMQAARLSFMQTSVVMALMAFLMVLAVVVSTDHMVLRRLALLGLQVRRVGESRDPNARVDIPGSDEITEVAQGINVMLGQIEESQSDLAYLASHDSLTRLHNRRRFESELRTALSTGVHGAVLWLDVDHFKEVNDSLGHAAGDELLAALADLIAVNTRGDGEVARLGGDEFGILAPSADEDVAIGLANRVLDLTSSKPFCVGGHEVRISVSIGIVLFPDHGASIDDLLSRADLAMYQAKSAGRNAVSIFTSDEQWQSEMTDRIAMAEQIVHALHEDSFELYAMPLQDVGDADNRLYELLLRMHAPDGSLIMPDRIIPTAERVGLIRDIDRWVAHHSIQLLAAEQAAGRHTSFAINISGAAFSDPQLLDAIREDIRVTGADPSRLIIEITETTAISNVDAAQRFIAELREIGCRFSLDDFGAGTSSFYYLKHLPIDYLKIDGSLVRSLNTNETDSHFVRAIVEMCRGLNISTVAEYVESAALFDAIRNLGVDFAQGYEVGRPQPLSTYLEQPPQTPPDAA